MNRSAADDVVIEYPDVPRTSEIWSVVAEYDEMSLNNSEISSAVAETCHQPLELLLLNSFRNNFFHKDIIQ